MIQPGLLKKPYGLMMGLLWDGLIIGTLYGKHRLTFLHQRIRTYMTSSNWPQIPEQKWILDHQMKKTFTQIK